MNLISFLYIYYLPLMLPYFNGPIFAAGSDTGPIGTPIQGKDLIGMSRQSFDGLFLTPRNVPQFGRRIGTGADDVGRIGRPRHLVDGADMTRQGHDEFSRQAIPQFDLFVKGRTGKEPTVGTKFNVTNQVLVSRQSFDGVFGGDGMPDKERIIITSRNQGFFGTRGLLKFLVAFDR